MNSTSSQHHLGNRVEFYFTERHPGVTVSVKEMVTMKMLYCINLSHDMGELLEDTPFLLDPAGILEDVFLGKWKISGFLSSASAISCKASVLHFLKANESSTHSSHILNGTIRLLRLLGYIFGPDAYRPWVTSYQHTLPESIQVSQVHPSAMLEMCNNHIHGFFTAHRTNHIKSYIERGGTIATFISENMLVMGHMIESLGASSWRHLAAAVLRPPVTTPHVDVQAPKRPPKKGLALPPRTPRPLAGLKGFCLAWLQGDVMPCTSTRCKSQVNSPVSKKLKHRQEFDLLPAAQRSEIVAEAKKLTPSGVVKVVA